MHAIRPPFAVSPARGQPRDRRQIVVHAADNAHPPAPKQPPGKEPQPAPNPPPNPPPPPRLDPSATRRTALVAGTAAIVGSQVATSPVLNFGRPAFFSPIALPRFDSLVTGQANADGEEVFRAMPQIPHVRIADGLQVSQVWLSTTTTRCGDGPVTRTSPTGHQGVHAAVGHQSPRLPRD